MATPLDTKIPELVINETTEELLKTQEIIPNQIYVTPDDDEGGSVKIDVDSELSLESENPVQNKIITSELNNKVNIQNSIENEGVEYTSKIDNSNAQQGIKFEVSSSDNNKTNIELTSNSIEILKDSTNENIKANYKNSEIATKRDLEDFSAIDIIDITEE